MTELFSIQVTLQDVFNYILYHARLKLLKKTERITEVEKNGDTVIIGILLNDNDIKNSKIYFFFYAG